MAQNPDSRQGLANTGDCPLSPELRLARSEQLIREHQESVFRYAYRLSGCSATAEDIAQEVFLRAFRSVHQLRDDTAARGWLLAIARNEFLRHCRRKSSGSELLDPHLEVVSEPGIPAIDHQEWVGQALHQLPDEFRLVLLMYYFEELSYAQIAEQLKIPMGTIMSRLSRGKAHLRAALEKSDVAQDLRRSV